MVSGWLGPSSCDWCNISKHYISKKCKRHWKVLDPFWRKFCSKYFKTVVFICVPFIELCGISCRADWRSVCSIAHLHRSVHPWRCSCVHSSLHAASHCNKSPSLPLQTAAWAGRRSKDKQLSNPLQSVVTKTFSKGGNRGKSSQAHGFRSFTQSFVLYKTWLSTFRPLWSNLLKCLAQLCTFDCALRQQWHLTPSYLPFASSPLQLLTTCQRCKVAPLENLESSTRTLKLSWRLSISHCLAWPMDGARSAWGGDSKGTSVKKMTWATSPLGHHVYIHIYISYIYMYIYIYLHICTSIYIKWLY